VTSYLITISISVLITVLTDSIGLYVVEHVFKVIWCNTRSCRRL